MLLEAAVEMPAVALLPAGLSTCLSLSETPPMLVCWDVQFTNV